MAEKKYINHKKFNSKLNYIIRAYGLSGVISEKIKKAIKESEAADVEEVVRCKDCVHKCPYNRYEFHCKCLRDNLHHNTDDYCSYGERKVAVDDKQKT